MLERTLEDGIRAADQLQEAIDAATARTPLPNRERLILDHGSEVTDLTRCADIRVYSEDGGQHRQVSIVTAKWMNELLESQNEAEREFSTGGPLCIVAQISGESIARAVAKYLDREHRD